MLVIITEKAKEVKVTFPTTYWNDMLNLIVPAKNFCHKKYIWAQKRQVQSFW